MRAAYADPPYLGCADKYYGALHPNAADYDNPRSHELLIESLNDQFDCWALSLNEPSLRTILPMCPEDVRIAAWVKPFASFKLNVTRAYAWEPVIFRFSNKRTKEQGTWRDFIIEPITLRRNFVGAKPDKVCFWIFEGLNIELSDTFVDLFPGSGAVTKAFEKWRRAQIGPSQFRLDAPPSSA